MFEFKPWPKITRIENKRPPIFTEKIDGTNACVVIEQHIVDGVLTKGATSDIKHCEVILENNGYRISAQKRTSFISPDDDNYDFAKWVWSNAEELVKLGEGHHFGEWWGNGIQRGYDQEEKHFSLFNTRRWHKDNPNLPLCCKVVPIIRASSLEEAKQILISNGSFVAPGFMNVEGLVMYEPDTDTCFKVIINK